jgi:hypothetical protein
MKPRQRLLGNLLKFHMAKIDEHSDYWKTEKVSKVLLVINKKINHASKRSL